MEMWEQSLNKAKRLEELAKQYRSMSSYERARCFDEHYKEVCKDTATYYWSRLRDDCRTT